MPAVVPFATPWWVNLLILAPMVPWLLSLKERTRLGARRLGIAAFFGIAFGFVEAAVVVYLRAALGLAPGAEAKALFPLPANLLRIETIREVATVIMLAGIAWLAGQNIRERVTAFLWTFAFWDAFYYVWLRATIGWPVSLLDFDVLFLIPTPWVSQVWFPLLIDGLTVVAVWWRSSESR